MNRRPLQRSPIVEALLDVRVELPEGAFSQLSSIQQSLGDRFPIKRERAAWAVKINAGPGMPVATPPESGPRGYHFLTSDEKEIVQAREDGFTYNRVGWFDNWPSFLNAAKTYWGMYREAAQPLSCKRLGLRFINRIHLPPNADFADYFALRPNVPPDTGSIAGFLMRLVMAHPSRKDLICIVTQTIEAPHASMGIPVLLDIDVVREQPPSDEQMWADFADMRTFANDVFFRSLTEKALEAYR